MYEYDRHGAGRLQQRPHGRAARGQNDVRRDAAISAACLRMSSALPPVQRVSIRMLWPLVQPNCCSPCTNAARRACPSGSSAAVVMSTPIRRIRSGCCALAASGHVTAAPLMSVTNSRRFSGRNCIRIITRGVRP